MTVDPSLYTVGGVIILDNDGKRLLGKYFGDEFPTLKEQKPFEKKIFEKTRKRDDEIVLLDGQTICYKTNVDLLFYVIGSQDENELLLSAVLNCVYDSISLILRKNVEKRALYHHLENVFLAIDEIIDQGIIMEIDPNNVYNRLAIRSEDIPLSETNLSQFLERAKEEVKWSFFK
ncbi:Oidioi.mRNA.OKI2018_I69.PAR.g11499.t1.cds [Oikopleura dioica]|uniref:Coatomer subunit zeta n=1 Tax=Oikopleura dioica TaxID=34765 RepID=A0ABN7RVU6_OIKDI|nr:Oidioi.mRNA.OKI2018_I69.PAR.g11499.t1.cds [Oikopleura dioica]